MAFISKFCLIPSIAAILPLFGCFNCSYAEEIEAEGVKKEAAISDVVIEGKRSSENKWYAGVVCDLGSDNDYLPVKY